MNLWVVIARCVDVKTDLSNLVAYFSLRRRNGRVRCHTTVTAHTQYAYAFESFSSKVRGRQMQGSGFCAVHCDAEICGALSSACEYRLCLCVCVCFCMIQCNFVIFNSTFCTGHFLVRCQSLGVMVRYEELISANMCVKCLMH